MHVRVRVYWSVTIISMVPYFSLTNMVSEVYLNKIDDPATPRGMLEEWVYVNFLPCSPQQLDATLLENWAFIDHIITGWILGRYYLTHTLSTGRVAQYYRFLLVPFSTG